MQFAEKNNYDYEDLGVNLIGANFIVLTHEEDDLTVSFVLTGMAKEYMYDCVYTDV